MEKEKKNIIIGVLAVVLLIATGFICYDKFLKKTETVSNDCNCQKCEKCDNKINQNEELTTCTIDMKGKTEFDVYNTCLDSLGGEDTRVIVKNISINGKMYELWHVFEFNDNSEIKAYDNSVTKLYVNGKLLDVYKGEYRNILWALKIKNNKLSVEETWPSDAGIGEHTYDLTGYE